MSDRRLTLTEVLALLGVSRWTLRRMIAAGEFPAPVYMNGKKSLMRWRETEVLERRAAMEKTAPESAAPRRGRPPRSKASSKPEARS